MVLHVIIYLKHTEIGVRITFVSEIIAEKCFLISECFKIYYQKLISWMSIVKFQSETFETLTNVRFI